MQVAASNERIICRLYIRKRCSRGNNCPFYHPEFNFNPDSPTISWLNFCRDFQRGQCFQQDCRYFHVTRDEEDAYRMRKDIAPTLLEQAMRKALLLDVSLTGTRATCKGFLQGGCNQSMCPYRHVSRHEFANEVLNTLRNEFEIVLGTSGTDVPGLQQLQNPMSNRSNNLPLMNDRMQMQNMVANPPLINTAIEENPTEKIRRLEAENKEIYLALDPDQKADSLEQIRMKLLTLQAALQWKEETDKKEGGFTDDGVIPGMAVVNYDHSAGNMPAPNIDMMRRRDAGPMMPMIGRNDGFQGKPMMEMDNYDNAPMDLDQDYSQSEEERDCKLFIGGLDSRTDTKTLENYFARYGKIVDAVVMKHKKLDKSRGFGFVTFAKRYMAMDAEQDGPHRIDGKRVDTKFAQPREEDGSAPPRRNDRNDRNDRSPPRDGGGGRIPKLFIGGLPNEITTDVLRGYFGRYGRIVDVVAMKDPKTQKPRGFGFVEFADDEATLGALSDGPHSILGFKVTVDKSVPRGDTKKSEPPRGSYRNERESRNSTSERCKMFVGGLSYGARESDLEDYFERFGKIRDVKINVDNKGASKGFGFVIFEESYMVEDAIDAGPHELDGRTVDCGFAKRNDRRESRDQRDQRDNRDRDVRSRSPNRASPEPTDNGDDDEDGACKLYVGNINDLEEEDIEKYFQNYGEIVRSNFRSARRRGRKGFAFIIYKDPQMVDNALDSAPHEIDGCVVEVGRAVSRGDKRPNTDNNDTPGGTEQPCKMFVGNLAFDATEESLYETFNKYGDIKEIKMGTDAKGSSKGYAFIVFSEDSSVQEAIDDGPHEVDGRELKLGTAHNRGGRDNKDGPRRRDQRQGSQSGGNNNKRRKVERRSHLD